MGLGGYSSLYMIGFWGCGIPIGLAIKQIQPYSQRKADVLMGLSMGISGAIAMLALMQALSYMSAVVIFPVRSCGNTALTALLSYAIWREDITGLQWLGIICAIVSIYFLV